MRCGRLPTRRNGWATLSLSALLATALLGAGPAVRAQTVPVAAASSAAPPLDALEACARAGGPEATDCFLLWTARLRSDVSEREVSQRVTRVARSLLREGRSPTAVASGARVLGRLGDRFSRDLVLLTLLHGRGGPEAGPALLETFQSLEGPWTAMYLEYVSLVSPHEATRQLAAAMVRMEPPSAGPSEAPALDAVDAVDAAIAGLPRYFRPRVRELEAATAMARQPEDVHGFATWLDQPSWYPDHVHLTIDDGPRAAALIPALDVLAHHGVKASFYFVGAALARRWMKTPDATSALVQRVLDEGHRVAFHSMNHTTAPSGHIRRWEPEQIADSVDAFRAVLNHVAGRRVRVTRGRLPGGMGLRWTTPREGFFRAGLFEHVHWSGGPPAWVMGASNYTVRRHACAYARRDKPTVVLLHEYDAVGEHLDVFLTEIRESCPATGDERRHRAKPVRFR